MAPPPAFPFPAARGGRREKEDFEELSKLVVGSGDACGWRILRHSCCLCVVLKMVDSLTT